MNVNQQPKSRKKRKGNEINTSTEDDIPAKSRKRKSKIRFFLFFKKIFILNKFFN